MICISCVKPPDYVRVVREVMDFKAGGGGKRISIIELLYCSCLRKSIPVLQVNKLMLPPVDDPSPPERSELGRTGVNLFLIAT